MTDKRHTILIGVLVAVCALLDLCVPKLFDGLYADVWMYVAFFLGGGLVGQVCLLAIWAALGPQPAPIRIPLTLSCVALGAFCYVLGLRWMDRNLPLDVALVMCGTALLGYLAMQVPLWVFRAGWKLRIASRDSDPLTADQERSQFGLRHLLIWTTLIAVVLVVGKNAMPGGSITTRNTPWLEIGFVMLVCGTFVTLLGIPCLWLALGDRGRGAWLAFVLLVLLLGPPLVMTLLTSVLGGGGGGEVWRITVALYCLGVGLLGCVILVLLILRGLGYRLLGVEDSPKQRITEDGRAAAAVLKGPPADTIAPSDVLPTLPDTRE